MRRFASCLALLAVTACGSGAASDDGAPRAQRPTITYEQAVVVARAGTLTAKDLPGYVRDPDDDEEDPGGTCLRGPDSLAEHGATYRRARVMVGTDAYVHPTSESAAAHVRYVSAPAFADCFERAFTAELATGELTVTRWAAKPVAVRVPGADETFGYTVRLTVRPDRGRAVPATMHFLGAAHGHAEVTVVVFGIATRTPSVARATALLVKATKRAAAKDA